MRLLLVPLENEGSEEEHHQALPSARIRGHGGPMAIKISAEGKIGIGVALMFGVGAASALVLPESGKLIGWITMGLSLFGLVLLFGHHIAALWGVRHLPGKRWHLTFFVPSLFVLCAGLGGVVWHFVPTGEVSSTKTIAHATALAIPSARKRDAVSPQVTMGVQAQASLGTVVHRTAPADHAKILVTGLEVEPADAAKPNGDQFLNASIKNVGTADGDWPNWTIVLHKSPKELSDLELAEQMKLAADAALTYPMPTRGLKLLHPGDVGRTHGRVIVPAIDWRDASEGSMQLYAFIVLKYYDDALPADRFWMTEYCGQMRGYGKPVGVCVDRVVQQFAKGGHLAAPTAPKPNAETAKEQAKGYSREDMATRQRALRELSEYVVSAFDQFVEHAETFKNAGASATKAELLKQAEHFKGEIVAEHRKQLKILEKYEGIADVFELADWNYQMKVMDPAIDEFIDTVSAFPDDPTPQSMSRFSSSPAAHRLFSTIEGLPNWRNTLLRNIGAKRAEYEKATVY